MPDRVYLHPTDPELRPGAQNAIDTCLRLKPQERITIITDTFTRDIAAALQSEVERGGSEYSLFVLAHHARRPLSHMPEIILDDLAQSQVSIFASDGKAYLDEEGGRMITHRRRFRAIIVLIPRANAAWIVAVHRFVEVSVGLLVALAVTAVWPEPQRDSEKQNVE